MARVTIVSCKFGTGKTVVRHIGKASEGTARIMFLKGDGADAVSPN